jgi:beta-1,4-mannosyltransferase
MSPGASGADDNPFVSLLVDHLPQDIEVRPFSWRSAFLSRYDVLHIHWPEHILKAGSRFKATVKDVMFVALVLRNRLVAHQVRTVHNIKPHEGGSWLNRLALSYWERSCDASVHLSDAGRVMVSDHTPATEAVTIVHGDYTPFVEKLHRTKLDAIPGRLLVFGYLRPYKGIEQLVAAFRQIDPSREVSLRIVGSALPTQYGDVVRALCDGDDRIEIVIRRLGDAELVDEITSASAVVLPYKQVYNSGAALLSLTLDRPILVTDSETMRELAAEVGEEWVRRLPEWSAATVIDAFSRLPPKSSSPRLTDRTWNALSARYAEVYRRVSGYRRYVGAGRPE